MTTLQEYISSKYGSDNWFVEFVNEIPNQQKVQDVLRIKDYLEGEHEIKKKPSYKFGGKTIEPRKIILNQAHGIINFMTSFLLGHNVTITGEEEITKVLNKVYKKGKYNRLDYKILERSLKYGEMYEYIYLDHHGNIKSKLIDRSSGYPFYNENNEMMAFVESFTNDGITYWIVYDNKFVSKYSNEGEKIHLKSRYANLSGLPISYINPNEYSDIEGVSELNKWANILDNQEDLLSRAVDGYYRYITGIPVISGQILKGEGIPKDILGMGLVLDDGSTFSFESNSFDANAFKTLYQTLENTLYDVAQIPSIVQGRTDISNVSTEAIRILYSNAIMKAQKNQQFIQEGIEKRLEVIIKLLQDYKGYTFSDDQIESVGINFKYSLPSSDKELIENLNTLREMKAISIESIIEQSPYVDNIQNELEKLAKERDNNIVNEIDDNIVNAGND
jgi:Phage portal protein, SPP1 Gp6-like